MVPSDNSLFDGYEIKTLIGTPPQQAKLWLDTSTSLIAVPSGDSQNCDCTMCFEHGYSFASSESTSLQSAQGVGGDVVDTVQIGSIATQGMAISTSLVSVSTNHRTFR